MPSMAVISSTSVKLSKSKDFSEKDFICKLHHIIQCPIWIINITGITVVENSASLSVQPVSRTRRALTMLKLAIFGLMHLYNLARVLKILAVRLNGAGYVCDLLVMCLFILYAATSFVCENLAMRFSLEPMIRALLEYDQKFGFHHDIVRKNGRFSKAMTIFIFFINIMFILEVFIGTQWYILSDLVPFISNSTATIGKNVMSGLYCILSIPLLLTIQGPILLHTLFLRVIVGEFQATTKFLTRGLKVCDDQTERMFNLCRERHQSLCRILATFNKLTRMFVSTCILFNMVTTFIYIYDFANLIKMPGFWAKSLGGIGTNVAIILFVVYQWGKLPNAAHSIVDAVAEADWSLMPKDLIQKMGLLLDKCSNQKIGVNVLGLFTVDSSTPMMVLGTMLTYGLVVLQF